MDSVWSALTKESGKLPFGPSPSLARSKVVDIYDDVVD